MINAIVAKQPGGPEVLEWAAVPAPQPGPGELLVETIAAGVNFIETYRRSGLYPVAFPYRPGEDGCGRVIAVGAGALLGGEPAAVGDIVTTGEASGTYAEQFVVAADRAVRVPAGVTPEQAAALPMQGLTAHYLATSAATPAAGDTVLVHAGAGGVGLLLTQLLTARGVRVLTTASTDEKRALSLAAGAIASVEYEASRATVRELTDGAGAAVVYDGVGRDTFDESLLSLRTRGKLVLFGAASGPVPPFDLQRLNAAGSISVIRPTLGHYLLTAEERAWRYSELFDAIERGELDLRIGATFALENAADAHRALEGRTTTGKVLLTR